jgi:hypothetical protein
LGAAGAALAGAFAGEVAAAGITIGVKFWSANAGPEA